MAVVVGEPINQEHAGPRERDIDYEKTKGGVALLRTTWTATRLT
jgi:hypothetical protein